MGIMGLLKDEKQLRELIETLKASGKRNICLMCGEPTDDNRCCCDYDD
jgi:hypothetical protein